MRSDGRTLTARRTRAERPADGRSEPLAVSVLADLFAVAVFVAVGRHSHHESLAVSGLLSTAGPFVIGLAVGHLGIVLTRWPTFSLQTGAGALTKTVIIGMVLRHAVQHEGTPLSFVIVTVLVLGIMMLGWRAAARAL